jgi:hypothetical protein
MAAVFAEYLNKVYYTHLDKLRTIQVITKRENPLKRKKS